MMGGEVGEIDGHLDTVHDVNYFGEVKQVNSHHNMYIKTPPPKSIILVNDDQGNCESWIDGKLAGLVWHPERMSNPWIPDEIDQLLTK
jgi:gamma-glutamyl-gamma-aminobutyrate hydrolase PuuD